MENTTDFFEELKKDFLGFKGNLLFNQNERENLSQFALVVHTALSDYQAALAKNAVIFSDFRDEIRVGKQTEFIEKAKAKFTETINAGFAPFEERHEAFQVEMKKAVIPPKPGILFHISESRKSARGLCRWTQLKEKTFCRTKLRMVILPA